MSSARPEGQPMRLGNTPHPACGHPLPSSDEGRGQGEGHASSSNLPSSMHEALGAFLDADPEGLAFVPKGPGFRFGDRIISIEPGGRGAGE